MADKIPTVPTIDDLINLKMPTQAKISPDGHYVAYTVQKPDWKENTFTSQIWRVNTQGEPGPRQLTYAKQSSQSPQWSPDGQWLTFLSKRKEDDHTAIYRISPFGGEAEALVKIDADIQSYFWSPDSKHIAFIASDSETQADKDRKEKYGDYSVEDVDLKYAHLWVFDVEGKKSRKITSGKAYSITDFDWQPDSEKIAFAASPSPNINDFPYSRIYTVDLKSLDITTLTDFGYSTPHWSPDGTQIACQQYTVERLYLNNHLCILDADSGESQVIDFDFDEGISLFEWREQGIYFSSVWRTAIYCYRLDLETKNYQPLIADADRGLLCFGLSVDSAEQHAVTVAPSSTHYWEVMLIELQNGTSHPLTTFDQQLDNWQLGQSELIEWESADGTIIEGIITKPADFDPSQKYPLLVVTHGGPTWISTLTKLDNYHCRIYPVHQWVAKGAVVLQPNYRGSAGYGEVFRSLNVRDLGTGDYADVISGVDALIEQGYIDEDRIGSMGWSQGGYISAFITTFSDRFKAVSVGAGISNWVTYYTNTDIHLFTLDYLEANPWDDPEIYQKTSPMTYIKQAQTPTLIQHGEFDKRVPIPNAYELYQGLQDVGVETRLVVYKGMGHGSTQPRINRQIMEENFKWFNRFIWGEDSDDTTTKTVYIALSSKHQADDDAELPAIDRYTAERIHDVYHWARRDDAEFRILSGKLGLIAPDQPLTEDNHSMQAENVSEIAAKIAEQLKSLNVNKVIIYTGKVKDNPRRLIYLGCVQIAAGIAGGITVEHKEITEEGW